MDQSEDKLRQYKIYKNMINRETKKNRSMIDTHLLEDLSDKSYKTIKRFISEPGNKTTTRRENDG